MTKAEFKREAETAEKMGKFDIGPKVHNWWVCDDVEPSFLETFSMVHLFVLVSSYQIGCRKKHKKQFSKDRDVIANDIVKLFTSMLNPVTTTKTFGQHHGKYGQERLYFRH